MDVIKTYIPKRYRSKKLVNSGGSSGSTTVINSGSSDFSPSGFVDSDTFYSMFEYDVINDAIKAKKEFYSVAGITAYGTGTVGGGGGTGVAVYNGLDSTDISLALSAAMGKQLNDTKLNSSAISAWALASVKPVYAISEITGLGTALAGKSDTTHRHTISEITDFAHVHQWSAIENKPTTFAPSAHPHTVSNISDFPASMPASDVYGWAKAATKPAYSFSEIGSTPTTLWGYGITDALGINSNAVSASKLQTARTIWGVSFDGTNNVAGHLDLITADLTWGGFANGKTTIKGTTDGLIVYPTGINGTGNIFVNNNGVYHAGNSNRSDVNWTANTLIAATDITLNALASTDKSVKNFINKFNSMFDTDVNGNIVAKTNLYSVGGISAYQSGAGIAGLKLAGDMNANGKNITNLLSVSNQQSAITMGYGGILFEVLGTNMLNIADDGIYANTSIEANNLYASGTAQATEFKFGRYKFMEDTNGDLGIYNGTTKIATILKTRTNSNL